jgi:hypothetical protein
MPDSKPLKAQIKSTQTQVAAQQAQLVPSSGVVTAQPARSYPSSTAAYEDGVGFDSPTETIASTMRPMWNTPDTAIQQQKVHTVNMPTAATASGIAISPSVASTKLVAIPDMTAAVTATAGSQVQVSWSFSGHLNSVRASASFALYRDGTQIAPTVYGSSPAAGAKFSMTQTFIDSPGGGLHAYSVYWAVSNGVLTADGKGRYVHGLVLKPQ